jgi:hypothetical protein
MVNSNKKQVVIGISSLLKPVNDVRMYEKFALGIAKHTDFSVEVIGFASDKLPETSKIKFHSLFSFQRLSWKRLLAGLDFYKKILQLKVDVSICNSTDLQLFNSIYRIIFGKKIIYDIRENYLYNIFYLDNFSWFLKGSLGCLYRMKEWLVSGWNSCFFIAERSYKRQLPFLGNKSILLENKLAIDSSVALLKDKNHRANRAIVCGTISKGYGLYQVLKWAEEQYAQNKSFKLVISGMCPLESDFIYLGNILASASFIELNISRKPKPHREILDDLLRCEKGLLLYPENKGFVECVPTKLYEFLHYQVDIVSGRNLFWCKLVELYSYPLFAKDYSDLYWDNEIYLLNKVLMNITNL